MPSKLHALLVEKKWSQALARIQSHPKEAHTTHRGDFPIHILCKNSPNISTDIIEYHVIEALIHVSPSSLKQRNKTHGRLPLHVAIRYSNDNVIRMILNKYKDGAAVRSLTEELPLTMYLYYSSRPSFNMIKTLVESYPTAVRIYDERGWLPLHYTTKIGDWTMCSYLIELYPNGILQKTREHKTPHDLAYHFGFKRLGDRFKEEEERIYSVRSNNTLSVTNVEKGNNVNISVTELDTGKILISSNSSNNFGEGKKSESIICSRNSYPLDRVSTTLISQCVMLSASTEDTKEKHQDPEILDEKYSNFDSEKKHMDKHSSDLTNVKLVNDNSNHKSNNSWCGINDPVTCRIM